jgi:hypothetical protein
MSANIPESDWRHFKRLHPLLLERFCQRTLEELAAVLRAGEGSAHDRYCRAYALLAQRDKALARAFDDLRRSTAVMQLVIMRTMGLLGDEELKVFSERTQQAVRLEDLPWGAEPGVAPEGGSATAVGSPSGIEAEPPVS